MTRAEPSLSHEQREFWSKVADRYDRVVDSQIGPTTRSLVRERLAKESRLGQAVEFGCGTGFYTRVLADRAERVVATDLSPGMLALARAGVGATNVTFQVEDCQKTSLPDGGFDTVFMSLVIHFTDPDRTVVEMHRILKTAGRLIIANLDPRVLTGFDRVRCAARVVGRGLIGYRVKPPRGFGKHVLSRMELCDLLGRSGFTVVGTETIRDPSRSSNIPVDYVEAVKD